MVEIGIDIIACRRGGFGNIYSGIVAVGGVTVQTGKIVVIEQDKTGTFYPAANLYSVICRQAVTRNENRQYKD